MEYKKRRLKLFNVLFLLMLVPVVIGLINIVSVLFGNRYAGSLKVLPTNVMWIILFLLTAIYRFLSNIKKK